MHRYLEPSDTTLFIDLHKLNAFCQYKNLCLLSHYKSSADIVNYLYFTLWHPTVKRQHVRYESLLTHIFKSVLRGATSISKLNSNLIKHLKMCHAEESNTFKANKKNLQKQTLKSSLNPWDKFHKNSSKAMKITDKVSKNLLLWMISWSLVWNFYCVLDYLVQRYSLSGCKTVKKLLKRMFYGFYGTHSLYVVVVLINCDTWALSIGRYQVLIQYWCINFWLVGVKGIGIVL